MSKQDSMHEWEPKQTTMIKIDSKKHQCLLEAVFFVFALLFLGVYNKELLYRMQENSLFLSNNVFYEETTCRSAGLLIYASRYLLQFFNKPLIGSIFISAMLVAIERVVVTAKPASGRLRLLAFLPSLLLLLSITTIGYGIYDNIENTYFISTTICTLASVAIFWAYTKKKGDKAIYVIAALALCLFCKFGLYVFLPLLLIAADLFRQKDKKSYVVAGATILFAAISTYICCRYVYNENYLDCLLAPILTPYFLEPFICTVLSIVALMAYVAIDKDTDEEKFGTRFSLPVMAAAFVCVCLLSFNDQTYRSTLKMQHMVEDRDWKGILQESKNIERPTLTSESLRIIALKIEDKILTEMFDSPCRFDNLKGRYTNLEPLIYRPDMYLFFSQINQSYWWQMEAWVTTGRTVGLLKRFATYAILKNEQEMARKYLNLLKETSNYDKWAEEHEKYVGNRNLLIEDYPEYGSVLKNENPENIYCDKTPLPYVLAKYKGMNRTLMLYRLMFDLYIKNTKQFMADIEAAKPLFREVMPEYFQEMLVLQYMAGKKFPIQDYPISEEVVNRVQHFSSIVSQYQNNKEEGAKKLKDYQGSYCYFLAFSNAFTHIEE